MEWIVNSAVHHKVYGEGTVISYAGQYVKVRFSAKEATFVYPDAFSDFLKFDDSNNQERANAALQAKKTAVEPVAVTAATRNSTKDYTAFLQIMDTLRTVRPDFEQEIAGIKQAAIIRADDSPLGMAEHVKALILSQLSNYRKWEGIEENLDKLTEVFCQYDIDALLKADEAQLLNQLLDLKCGNLSVRSQISHLKDNLRTLQRIDAENGGIDRYYNSVNKFDLVDKLSNAGSNYKLQDMGIKLVCEYLKGIGIEVVKPDRHVARIIGRLGYSQKNPAGEIETLRICDDIAKTLNISNAMVDTVLWQYGVEKKCGICGDKPDCKRCGAVSCPSRKG